MTHANNQGADLTAHAAQLDQRLGCFRLLESVITKLSTNNISILHLVYVGEQTGLGRFWSHTSNTIFSGRCPYIVIRKMMDGCTNDRDTCQLHMYCSIIKSKFIEHDLRCCYLIYLDPKVKVKGQIKYFLVNESPLKLLVVATSNLADA